MAPTIAAPRLRSLLVWSLTTAGAALLLTALLPIPLSFHGTFDELLVRLCSAALVGCTVWFWAVTSAVVITALRDTGHAARLRGVPAPLRRLILLCCGAALAAGITGPALAAPGPTSPVGELTAPQGVDHSGRLVLPELPFPERATDRPEPDGGAGKVRVAPGDTLWGIASARMPESSSAADITAAWHRLYGLNRDVVGPDPDRLLPGQVLELPPGQA